MSATEGVVDVFHDDADGYFEFDQVLLDAYSSELLDLVQYCMEPVPSDRPTFPEVLLEIRKHRLTHQHDLRDKPADDIAWNAHLLLDATTNTVRIRAPLAHILEYVLTILQGFAQNMVSHRPDEWNLDSPSEMGGIPGAELLDHPVKVPPPGDLGGLATAFAPERTRRPGRQSANLPGQPQKPQTTTGKRKRPDERPPLKIRIKRGPQADAGAKTSAAEQNDAADEQQNATAGQKNAGDQDNAAVERNSADAERNSAAAEPNNADNQNDTATQLDPTVQPPVQPTVQPTGAVQTDVPAPAGAARQRRAVVRTAAADRPRRKLAKYGP